VGGLSRLSDLEPSEPIVRYEHEHSGDLVHIDAKKLGATRVGLRYQGIKGVAPISRLPQSDNNLLTLHN